MRRRSHVAWFWLAYAVAFFSWSAIDLARGVGDGYDWLFIGVMPAVALFAFYEPGRRPAWTPPSSSRVDFAAKDFDLAVGEVYGVRAWRLDSHGRLRALHITVAEPWRPGVNTAECAISPIERLIHQQLSALGRPGQVFAPGGLVTKPHEPPDDRCQCGFYAYTDIQHSENRATSKNEYVLGVIRGTGRTLIGTKGFRCQKAEIVALLDPTRGGRIPVAWRRRQRDQLRAAYPDVPLVSSKRQLVAAFPIERYEPTPDSDDFWAQS